MRTGTELRCNTSKRDASNTIIPGERIGYKMANTSQRSGKRCVGFNLIYNKREWNNCFISTHKILMNLLDVIKKKKKEKSENIQGTKKM